ncbi:uracil-DNA glycosylase family protein [Chryseolinea sp. T2]|uniref:uracil-DNA glycosylase family protein n=1 Tax=Chryseolinea sp. T2 TaxID=3129255 RepID=UPI003077F42D
MTFADHVLEILFSLRIGKTLPKGVEVLNPYREDIVIEICESFYRKFYCDTNERRILIGINPGRHGGGITGIPFTDPVKLSQLCGIPNELGKRTELSADFIYRVVAAFGGPAAFYGRYYFTAVSPLGFTFNGKNLNYYDLRELQDAISPFAVRSMEKLLKAPVDRTKAYCIGEGENFKFLTTLNKQHQWFDEIIPLAHPRFVMQYRRKQLDNYINEYVTKLSLK